MVRFAALSGTLYRRSRWVLGLSYYVSLAVGFVPLRDSPSRSRSCHLYCRRLMGGPVNVFTADVFGRAAHLDGFQDLNDL
jgi:hypothetical protein